MFNNWYRIRKSPGPNASFYERQLAKLNLRIEKLALKGKDNYLEYSKLIDEMIQKGEWSTFEQCVFYYYGISLYNIQDVNSIKRSSWREICFQTNTSFLNKLKKMYDQNSVYQTGQDIFSSNRNFVQIDLSSPLSTTFSSTNYSQSFSIDRVDDLIYLNVIDDTLNYVQIERAEWVIDNGVEIPVNKSFVQDFFIGTSSNQKDPDNPIKIELPVDVTRDYLIYTEERQKVLNNEVTQGSFSSSELGTASFTWDYNKYAIDYVADISTFSDYSILIPGYSNISITESNFTYVSGLSASETYYWRLTAVTTYLSSFTSSVSGSYTASWSIDPFVSGYLIELYDSSLVNTFTVGTISQPPFYEVSSLTASYIFTGLSASSFYYYRLKKIVGKYASLNYKLSLFKDPYLGKIIEREVFTPDAEYLVQNRQYASLVGARKTYLEVYKRNLNMPSGFATASIFAFDDLSRTEESNLLVRYTQAINYLNS